MTTRATVAVIGAGASGTLVAAQLAARASAARVSLDVLLIDPDAPGRGLAYVTEDPRHRLNVPARGMSAWPDDPAHFVRWLRRHVAVDFPEGGFAPRMHYAQYLSSVLDRSLQDASGVALENIAARVTDLRMHGTRLRVSLSDGTSRAADAAVMALGHGQPSTSWAPAELVRSDRFVADPWRPGAVPRIGRGDDVVLVGAGLTAADMAQRWGQEGVRVHVVSRHGMLPLAHAAQVSPVDFSHVELPDTLQQARRFVFEAIRNAGGDWRSVMDGLRPFTQNLWSRLDDHSRRSFLHTAARRWDRARHRIDPALHEWLEMRRAEGSLVVHAATVDAAELIEGHVRVMLSDGSVLTAAAVLNCTGTSTGVRTSHDPLVLNLLSTGFAQPGPHDLGFESDAAGRVLSASGSQPAAWIIGPLRRGQLWESTAISEIRMQAAQIAREVLAALPAPSIRRRPRDPYGLPISATSGAATGYLTALNRILRVQSGAEALLVQAVRDDPEFALGHAALALLGAEWGADVDVNACLAAAHAPVARADERERRFVEVATARVHEPGAESAASLMSYPGLSRGRARSEHRGSDDRIRWCDRDSRRGVGARRGSRARLWRRLVVSRAAGVHPPGAGSLRRGGRARRTGTRPRAGGRSCRTRQGACALRDRRPRRGTRVA